MVLTNEGGTSRICGRQNREAEREKREIWCFSLRVVGMGETAEEEAVRGGKALVLLEIIHSDFSIYPDTAGRTSAAR